MMMQKKGEKPQPQNEVWYKTTDGLSATPSTSSGWFISGQRYEDGWWKATYTKPNPMTFFGTWNNNPTLKIFKLPEGVVTSFYNRALENNPSLIWVNIPEGVQTLGTYTCTNAAITKVMLPSTLLSTAGRNFQNCANLRIVLSKAVVAPTLNSLTFHLVTSITDVFVPYGSLSSYQSTWTVSQVANKFREYIDATGSLPVHNSVDYCLLDGHILYKWQDQWVLITDFDVPDEN